MSGDVSDQDADALFVNEDEVVEVPGDSSHRRIDCGNIKAGKARNFTRKNRGLNLPGDFKFLLNREQVLLIRVGTRGGNVAEATDQDEEADGLHAVPAQSAEVGEIVLNHKQGKNQKTCICNFEFARQPLSAWEREGINQQ